MLFALHPRDGDIKRQTDDRLRLRHGWTGMAEMFESLLHHRMNERSAFDQRTVTIKEDELHSSSALALS